MKKFLALVLTLALAKKRPVFFLPRKRAPPPSTGGGA